MKALRLASGDPSAASWLLNTRLQPDARFNEAWLQEVLFARPELIPLAAIEPGAERMIPICREFPLPKECGTVFADLLGVTLGGKLVLVECKLWRNPQARREVIAQIFEYAALLRGWSYGDLSARRAGRLGWAGPNALWRHVREAAGADLDEARFVDGVAQSLARGDFLLLIAGDGMRADVHAIAAYLDRQLGLAARLALVEFRIWHDAASGDTIVLPWIPVRTTVLEQRLLIGPNGLPVALEPEQDAAAEIEEQINPAAKEKKAQNRLFWQRFIDTLRLDHPEQPRPAHGGNNWVRLRFPPPAEWLTVYRTPKELGLFFRLRGKADEALALLEAQTAGLRAKLPDLAFAFSPATLSSPPSVGLVETPVTGWSEEQQRAWLGRATNATVSIFRP
jgi:hypothetical protein